MKIPHQAASGGTVGVLQWRGWPLISDICSIHLLPIPLFEGLTSPNVDGKNFWIHVQIKPKRCHLSELANDPIPADFIKRLDAGEVDGRLNLELSQLSYAQLLTVSRILRMSGNS